MARPRCERGICRGRGWDISCATTCMLCYAMLCYATYATLTYAVLCYRMLLTNEQTRPNILTAPHSSRLLTTRSPQLLARYVRCAVDRRRSPRATAHRRTHQRSPTTLRRDPPVHVQGGANCPVPEAHNATRRAKTLRANSWANLDAKNGRYNIARGPRLPLNRSRSHAGSAAAMPRLLFEQQQRRRASVSPAGVRLTVSVR